MLTMNLFLIFPGSVFFTKKDMHIQTRGTSLTYFNNENSTLS